MFLSAYTALILKFNAFFNIEHKLKLSKFITKHFQIEIEYNI